ncbi:MAG: DNA/RNA non-specific endonuclease [Tunicatimonas sp.]
MILQRKHSYQSTWRYSQGLLILGLLTGCLKLQEASSGADFNYWPAWKEKPVVHTHFALGYSEAHEQAAWVAYELTPEEVAVNLDREGNFREDPLVATGSASLEDYRRSGYDRGHLAPVGDMNFDPVAMEESFYLSNISPQKRAFNGGIWSRLENQVRNWAADRGGLYVVTGPVLGQAQRTIGKNQVTVPNYFYKVLLDERGNESRMIALVVPTTARGKDLREFVEKVDNVEAYTGIDFFPSLPDDLEERLEREVVTEGWFE